MYEKTHADRCQLLEWRSHYIKRLVINSRLKDTRVKKNELHSRVLE